MVKGYIVKPNIFSYLREVGRSLHSPLLIPWDSLAELDLSTFVFSPLLQPTKLYT